MPSVNEADWFRSNGSAWTTNGTAGLERDPKYGAEMLHVEWVEGETAPAVEVTSWITTRDRAIDLSKPGDTARALRVRLGTLTRIAELSQHEADGCQLQEREGVAVEIFPILGETAATVEPRDRAFDDPTLGQSHEAFGVIGSSDDYGFETRQSFGEGVGKNRALIGAVGKQLLEEWKLTEQRGQQQDAAIAILDAGGMHDDVQQQAQRINENMPLLALDQLAGIEPVRIDAGPPFSALLTL